MEEPTHKQCRKCHQIKPIERYNYRDRSNHKRRSDCKDCQSEYARLRRANSDKVEERRKIRETEKNILKDGILYRKCCRCYQTKPIGRFPKHYGGDRAGQYMAYCYDCNNVYRRQHRKENPEIYRRKYDIMKAEGKKRFNKHTYKRYRIKGFTHDMYLALHEKQGGVCAICQQPEKVKDKNGEIRSLAVDHNHETGEVRGLLCFRCNTQLHVLENRNIKEAAQNYLSQ